MLGNLSVGPLVLVVKDDQDIREIYAESLTLNGYEVHLAADGQEALALAFAELPRSLSWTSRCPS